jgi:hypothetical protein
MSFCTVRHKGIRTKEKGGNYEDCRASPLRGFARNEIGGASPTLPWKIKSQQQTGVLAGLGRALGEADDPTPLDSSGLVLFDGNLQDGFMDFSAAYQWSVGMLRKEDDE